MIEKVAVAATGGVPFASGYALPMSGEKPDAPLIVEVPSSRVEDPTVS
jgi:hypothetical protein